MTSHATPSAPLEPIPSEPDRDSVRAVLTVARTASRTSLTAPEAQRLCAAYGIATPRDGLASSDQEAVAVAEEIGYPVVLKIVSAAISHKSDAGGVITGVRSSDEVITAYRTILENARAYDPHAVIEGVQIQEMLAPAREVIIGAIRDPTFGPLATFGLGGVLVEVLRDVTFRLAPTSAETAMSMVTDIAGADVLRGVRGAAPVDVNALVGLIQRVSALVDDFPEIAAAELNPVLAREDGAVAVDVRIELAASAPERPPGHGKEEILAVMNRMMHPRAIAVIGASAEQGKIGNSVLRNLVDGGYRGEIYPVNPKGGRILGKECHERVADLPAGIDLAVVAIPAQLVPATMTELGAKEIPAAVLIPSGFAETGNVELQEELKRAARAAGVRFIGPNIYGFYYTPNRLSATFCTPYDVAGSVALVSQSGGIGMAILGFSRSTNMGVSAIVGLGNKADIDEDDLLTFFEQDEATRCVALHMEDLKDGRAFVAAAKRITRTKPVLVLKAGSTAAGTRAAASHTAALAGDDKVYDDILRESGVVRARGLRELLEFARSLPLLPTPKGENVLIITGAGGSGVLLADACTHNGLSLMEMPVDLDAAFRELIPPFGAAGNPVDITGGEPPSTYREAIRLGLADERVDALILGYWHTIITPPAVFADLVVDVVSEFRAQGIEKPVVASLAGDVQVEQAAEHLFAHGIAAFPYTTETPVEVLGAKYRWARMASGTGALP